LGLPRRERLAPPRGSRGEHEQHHGCLRSARQARSFGAYAADLSVIDTLVILPFSSLGLHIDRDAESTTTRSSRRPVIETEHA
jgi:hypothetical protein